VKTLPEVADILGLAKAMKEPERFLTRQIKAGKIRARRIGRHWLMTDADIDFALDQFANTVQSEEPAADHPIPVGAAPSVASMRRRRPA